MERVNHISGIHQTVLFLNSLKFRSRISFLHSWGNLHRQHRVDQRQSAGDASHGPKDTDTSVVMQWFREKGAEGCVNKTHFTLVPKQTLRGNYERRNHYISTQIKEIFEMTLYLHCWNFLHYKYHWDPPALTLRDAPFIHSQNRMTELCTVWMPGLPVQMQQEPFCQ